MATLASGVDFCTYKSADEGLYRYGYYKAQLTYDSVTRSGKKVTLNNAKIYLARQGSGYTYYRLAARVGIGGSTTNVYSNATMVTAGTQSPTSVSFSIGSPSIETTGTSFKFYVALASTGHSTGWDTFKGNSPVVLFNGSITCPPANPTFTTAPSFSNIEETSFSINFGTTDIASTIYFREDTDTDWTLFDATDNSIAVIGRQPNTVYKYQIKAISNFDSTMETIYPKESEWMTVSTYPFPSVYRAQLAGAENMENDLTMQKTYEEILLSNPKNRTIEIKLYSIDDNENEIEIYSKTGITGTNYKFYFPTGTAAAAMDKTAVSHTKYRYKCIYTYTELSLVYDEESGLWGTEEVEKENVSIFNPTNMSFTLDEVYCKPLWNQNIDSKLSQLILFSGDNTNIYINEENRVDNAELKYQTLDTVAGNMMIQNYSKIICTFDTDIAGAISQYSGELSKYKVCFDLNAENQIWYYFNINNKTWETEPIIDNQQSIISATIIAIDSRGFHSNPIGYNIKTIPYTIPQGILEAERTDGFGTDVKAQLTPSWFLNLAQTEGWFVYNIVGSDGQKQENIIYNIKNTDEDGNIITMEGTLNIDLLISQLEIDFKTDSSFDISGILIDSLGGKSELISAVISSGVPIFFIDAITQGVGANMYPNGKGYWGHEAHIDNIATQIVTLLTSNGNIEISADLLAKLKTLVAYNYFAIGNENGLYIKDNANHIFSSYTNSGNEQYNVGLKEQLRYGENNGSYSIVSETIESDNGIGYGHFWNGG